MSFSNLARAGAEKLEVDEEERSAMVGRDKQLGVCIYKFTAG